MIGIEHISSISNNFLGYVLVVLIFLLGLLSKCVGWRPFISIFRFEEVKKELGQYERGILTLIEHFLNGWLLFSCVLFSYIFLLLGIVWTEVGWTELWGDRVMYELDNLIMFFIMGELFLSPFLILIVLCFAVVAGMCLFTYHPSLLRFRSLFYFKTENFLEGVWKAFLLSLFISLISIIALGLEFYRPIFMFIVVVGFCAIIWTERKKLVELWKSKSIKNHLKSFPSLLLSEFSSPFSYVFKIILVVFPISFSALLILNILSVMSPAYFHHNIQIDYVNMSLDTNNNYVIHFKLLNLETIPVFILGVVVREGKVEVKEELPIKIESKDLKIISVKYFPKNSSCYNETFLFQDDTLFFVPVGWFTPTYKPIPIGNCS